MPLFSKAHSVNRVNLAKERDLTSVLHQVNHFYRESSSIPPLCNLEEIDLHIINCLKVEHQSVLYFLVHKVIGYFCSLSHHLLIHPMLQANKAF